MAVTLSVDNNLRKSFRELEELRTNSTRKVVASAITDTLFLARDKLIRVYWPEAVTVRSRSFMRAAFRVDRGRSRTLKGALYDRLKRAAISYQTEATTRVGWAGRRAVPTRYVEHHGRTQSGKVKKSLAPSNAKVFRVKNELFKKFGRGKSARVRKLYTLRQSVRQPKTFAIYERLERLANEVFPKHVINRMERKLQKLRANAH